MKAKIHVFAACLSLWAGCGGNSTTTPGPDASPEIDASGGNTDARTQAIDAGADARMIDSGPGTGDARVTMIDAGGGGAIDARESAPDARPIQPDATPEESDAAPTRIDAATGGEVDSGGGGGGADAETGGGGADAATGGGGTDAASGGGGTDAATGGGTDAASGGGTDAAAGQPDAGASGGCHSDPMCQGQAGTFCGPNGGGTIFTCQQQDGCVVITHQSECSQDRTCQSHGAASFCGCTGLGPNEGNACDNPGPDTFSCDGNSNLLHCAGDLLCGTWELYGGTNGAGDCASLGLECRTADFACHCPDVTDHKYWVGPEAPRVAEGEITLPTEGDGTHDPVVVANGAMWNSAHISLGLCTFPTISGSGQALETAENDVLLNCGAAKRGLVDDECATGAYVVGTAIGSTDNGEAHFDEETFPINIPDGIHVVTEQKNLDGIDGPGYAPAATEKYLILWNNDMADADSTFFPALILDRAANPFAGTLDEANWPGDVSPPSLEGFAIAVEQSVVSDVETQGCAASPMNSNLSCAVAVLCRGGAAAMDAVDIHGDAGFADKRTADSQMNIGVGLALLDSVQQVKRSGVGDAVGCSGQFDNLSIDKVGSLANSAPGTGILARTFDQPPLVAATTPPFYEQASFADLSITDCFVGIEHDAGDVHIATGSIQGVNNPSSPTMLLGVDVSDYLDMGASGSYSFIADDLTVDSGTLVGLHVSSSVVRYTMVHGGGITNTLAGSGVVVERAGYAPSEVPIGGVTIDQGADVSDNAGHGIELQFNEPMAAPPKRAQPPTCQFRDPRLCHPIPPFVYVDGATVQRNDDGILVQFGTLTVTNSLIGGVNGVGDFNGNLGHGIEVSVFIDDDNTPNDTQAAKVFLGGATKAQGNTIEGNYQSGLFVGPGATLVASQNDTVRDNSYISVVEKQALANNAVGPCTVDASHSCHFFAVDLNYTDGYVDATDMTVEDNNGPGVRVATNVVDSMSTPPGLPATRFTAAKIRRNGKTQFTGPEQPVYTDPAGSGHGNPVNWTAGLFVDENFFFSGLRRLLPIPGPITAPNSVILTGSAGCGPLDNPEPDCPGIQNNDGMGIAIADNALVITDQVTVARNGRNDHSAFIDDPGVMIYSGYFFSFIRSPEICFNRSPIIPCGFPFPSGEFDADPLILSGGATGGQILIAHNAGDGIRDEGLLLATHVHVSANGAAGVYVDDNTGLNPGQQPGMLQDSEIDGQSSANFGVFLSQAVHSTPFQSLSSPPFFVLKGTRSPDRNARSTTKIHGNGVGVAIGYFALGGYYVQRGNVFFQVDNVDIYANSVGLGTAELSDPGPSTTADIRNVDVYGNTFVGMTILPSDVNTHDGDGFPNFFGNAIYDNGGKQVRLSGGDLVFTQPYTVHSGHKTFTIGDPGGTCDSLAASGRLNRVYCYDGTNEGIFAEQGGTVHLYHIDFQLAGTPNVDFGKDTDPMTSITDTSPCGPITPTCIRNTALQTTQSMSQ